ncbi:hypothetical protein JCM39194_12490 [Desulfotomaculum varum]
MEHSGVDNMAISLVVSKTGLPVLKLGEYFLHSVYDPVKEARRLAEANYRENHLHILLGIGMGYLAREIFLKLGESDVLLIVEPNQSVFATALQHNRELQEILHKDNVFLNLGANQALFHSQMSLLMGKGFLGRVHVIEHPNYTRLYPWLVDRITRLLKDIYMMGLINLNTINTFGELWQKNFLLNLYHAFQSLPFSQLTNRLSCPVIIAAAGPSLTKQLPLLRGLKDKAFILCAGSAINSLLAGGVVPHAVVSVDGGEANYFHFKGLKINNIPLFYALTLHNEILEQHNGIKVVFNNFNSVFLTWTDKVLQRENGVVRGGFSVANFCLDIAWQLTVGPVCLIGQDLAYTGNRSHAEGNKNGRIIDLQDSQKQKRYTWTEGYYGDKVLTDYVFLGMKKAFEDYYQYAKSQNPDRLIANCTEGGAKIDGFVNMPFKDFIEQHCQKDCRQEMDSVFVYKVPQKQDWYNFFNMINKEKANIIKSIELCQKALKILEKLQDNGNIVASKLLANLDKIDKEIKKVQENNIMQYVIQPVLFRVDYCFPACRDESAKERQKRVLAKSRMLYEGIARGAEFALKYIDQLLSKVRVHLE